MGNMISADSKLAPISFASTMLSFITFTTTFATFINAFWSDLSTAKNARHEVHEILGGLGISLREERATLKRLRKRCAKKVRERAATRRWGGAGYGRRRHDGGDDDDDDDDEKADMGVKEGMRELAKRSSRREREHEEEEGELVWLSLENSIKGMLRSWEHIERPFRSRDSVRQEDGEAYLYGAGYPRHRDGRPSGRRRRSAGLSDKEREAEHATGWRGEELEAQVEGRRRYGTMTITRRFLWVRRKRDVMRLSEALTRLQTRRIARQMADANIMGERLMDVLMDIGERVEVVETRLNRVVGVRRVD